MQAHTTSDDPVTRRHRPKTLTVFAAAFAAGAVLAYGIDRVVDVHVVQVEPQVESEPIFVALRSLPQGAPLTVWDVALKDWPKAMLPTTALKADASLEGMVLRHPIREGQPLLSVQLVRDSAAPPMAGMAALPAAVGSTGVAMSMPAPSAAPDNAPAAAGTRGPAGVEHFVPATPAESPVAVTQPATVDDVADVSAAPQATTEPVSTAPAIAATDTDIDPSDPAAPVPSVVDSEALAVSDDVAAVEPIGGDAVAEPALVSTAVPPSAEPTVAQPLAAPVPTLPSTDIERSLVTVGRASQEPAVASVLDRSNQPPSPPAQPAAPRNHLVVPERVALAADASFAQQRAPAVRANPAAARPAAAAARSGSRGPKPVAPVDTSHQRTSPTGRKAAPSTRQPTGTKASTEPESSRPTGLGAWFPQLSGGSWRR